MKKKIFCVYGYLSISHCIKVGKKVRIYSFNLCAQSPLPTDIHALTIHVDKMDQLYFYEIYLRHTESLGSVFVAAHYNITRAS